MPYVTIHERKGYEKGFMKGIEEGRKHARFEIARALLDVLDEETIVKKTGLTVEDIRKLEEQER